MATFQINQKKYQDAFYLVGTRPLKIVGVIGIIMLAANVLPALFSENVDLKDSIPILITVPFMFGIVLFSWQKNIAKNYINQKDFQEPIELELNDAGLHWTLARSTTKLGWHEIEKLKEGKGLMLVFSTPQCFHFIDLAALSESEMALLRSKLT